MHMCSFHQLSFYSESRSLHILHICTDLTLFPGRGNLGISQRVARRQGDSAGQETAVRLYVRQGNAIRYSQLQPIGAGVPNTAGSHGIFAGNVSVLRLVQTVDGWVSPDSQSESEKGEKGGRRIFSQRG